MREAAKIPKARRRLAFRGFSVQRRRGARRTEPRCPARAGRLERRLRPCELAIEVSVVGGLGRKPRHAKSALLAIAVEGVPSRSAWRGCVASLLPAGGASRELDRSMAGTLPNSPNATHIGAARMDCIPASLGRGFRGRGGRRCEDPMQKACEQHEEWQQAAQDRVAWNASEEEFLSRAARRRTFQRPPPGRFMIGPALE